MLLLDLVIDMPTCLDHSYAIGFQHPFREQFRRTRLLGLKRYLFKTRMLRGEHGINIEAREERLGQRVSHMPCHLADCEKQLIWQGQGAYLETEKLIYDAQAFFWQQVSPHIVIVVHTLAWGKIPGVHLGVHDLKDALDTIKKPKNRIT